MLQRCDAAAVPHLIRALKDKEEAIRQAAVRSLQSVNAADEQLRGALLDALTDADPYVRAGALLALPRFGDAVTPQVEAGLKDSTPLVRRAAAAALGRLGVKAAPPLFEALKDSDDMVTEQAKQSLLALRVTKADSPIFLALTTDKLKDNSKVVRQGAALVLGRFKRDGVTPLLRAVVADPDADVRYMAAYALDDIGVPAQEAFPTLVTVARKDAEERTRNMAIKAMLKVNRLDHYWKLPAEAVPDLIKLLEGPNPGRRWEAALTLAALGPVARDAVPALEKALEDPDELVRKAAAQALMEIKAKEEG